MADFNGASFVKKNDFIIVPAKGSAECLVDIRHYYYFPEVGEYKLIFENINPKFESQKEEIFRFEGEMKINI